MSLSFDRQPPGPRFCLGNTGHQPLRRTMNLRRNSASPVPRFILGPDMNCGRNSLSSAGGNRRTRPMVSVLVSTVTPDPP